jgi:hypothetical protein
VRRNGRDLSGGVGHGRQKGGGAKGGGAPANGFTERSNEGQEVVGRRARSEWFRQRN